MSVRITVHQLQEQLPELLDRAVESGEECVIERDGEEYAVLVGAREWRRRHPATVSSLAAAAGGREQSDQDRRLREIGARLDALGPEYRLLPERQARVEELLAKEGDLTRAERRELRMLLRESDEIMLRRAEALQHLG